MHWIALWSPEPERTAWAWRALRFTPRVAWVEDAHWGLALVLEVSGSLRLWGGLARLERRFLGSKAADASVKWSSAATSLIALAVLRSESPSDEAAHSLPLATLSAAQPHLATLARIGCTTWGDVRALPRAGVARRFGAPLLDALDAAYGERPEAYPWLELPERFDHKLELPALATSTPELMGAAQRLLALLQDWLRARQQGVLALELEWTLDLKRHNGVPLPPTQALVLRTARPTQGMAHLRRLVAEHLAASTTERRAGPPQASEQPTPWQSRGPSPDRGQRTTCNGERGGIKRISSLAAPANALRLRSLETAPWAGSSTSLLVEDLRKGERLHELIERLSARLGAEHVLVPMPQADHRPECMQRWVSAKDATLPLGVGLSADPSGNPVKSPSSRKKRKAAASELPADTLYPNWLLREPLPLQVQRHVPQFHGPLQRLTRAQRIEAGWWNGPAQPLAQRDYYIARSEQAGLLWIYRERPLASTAHDAASSAAQQEARWFLHGVFA